MARKSVANEEPKVKKQVRDTKTHHQTGYHKPVKNPTNNFRMDSHSKFCKRCRAANLGCCPITNSGYVAKGCNL